MDAPVRRSQARLSVIPQSAAAPFADEMKIARQRMRHLAPWNVKPVPMMHSAGSKSSEPAPADQSDRTKKLALKVLAIHMSEAGRKGDLR